MLDFRRAMRGVKRRKPNANKQATLTHTIKERNAHMHTKKWMIQPQDSGKMFQYDTRAVARAAAKHKSRFDDCAYCVFKRIAMPDGSIQWQHVETHDFHKTVRAAFAWG
jgi:hypothetical protein